MGLITGSVQSDTAVKGSPSLRRFYVVQALNRGNGAATRYPLRRNTASMMKFDFFGGQSDIAIGARGLDFDSQSRSNRTQVYPAPKK